MADLANALAARGHDVFAAVIPGSPLLTELAGLPRENILELSMRNSLNVRGAFKLAQFVQKQRIEIIHAHVARDYSVAALAAARAGSVPFVLTRHMQFPMSRGHRITLRSVSRVIAVSRAVAESLYAQRVFDRNRIAVIHHGIDTGQFDQKVLDRTRTDREGRRQRVGTIGQLAPAKGQTDFVEAAAVVAKRMGDVEFIIAGEDKSRDGENRRRLEELCKRFGISERVKFLGRCEDLAQLLSSFDLFVSPSRIESFGLAIVEAMACGVPVVATRTGGAEEIIQDGETGKLVPVGDAKVLANEICALLEDSGERVRLSANARRDVGERFSLARMVDETEQIYLAVLAERRALGRAPAISSALR